MSMDPATARLIRAMHEAIGHEGCGFAGAAEDERLIVEAYTVTGASEHLMWDRGVIAYDDHDMSVCLDPYCVGARERAAEVEEDL